MTFPGRDNILRQRGRLYLVFHIHISMQGQTAEESSAALAALDCADLLSFRMRDIV